MTIVAETKTICEIWAQPIATVLAALIAFGLARLSLKNILTAQTEKHHQDVARERLGTARERKAKRIFDLQDAYVAWATATYQYTKAVSISAQSPAMSVPPEWTANEHEAMSAYAPTYFRLLLLEHEERRRRSVMDIATATKEVSVFPCVPLTVADQRDVIENRIEKVSVDMEQFISVTGSQLREELEALAGNP